MPKARISRSSIEKLEAIPGKQVSYFDTKITGFGVRINSTSRTYFVQCRVKDRKNASGKPLEIYESIGRTDVIDFEKAVTKAKAILENAAHGIAPDDIRRQNEDLEADKIITATNEARKDVTLQDVFKEYIITKKKLKASTIELYQEDIDRYLTDWKDLPLRSIDGNMVISKHAEIGKRSKARADGAMRILRALFNHAMHVYDDVIIKNPVKKLSAVGGWYKVPRRETYIKPADLKKWLPAVLKLGYDTTQDFILVTLFQGSRKTETSSLKWKDVNLVDGTAIFRETKTGVVLEVPISRFIIGRLKERMKYYYDGPDSYIFPSYGKTGHIVEAKAGLEVVRLATGIKATHHDLRRSFISYCEELEINIFSRKRLANHAIPLDVTEGYTMFSMEKLRVVVEKVAAFILGSAGIRYQTPESAPLTEDQAARIADTAFWDSLTDAQRIKFAAMMSPEKEQPQNVISLEAVKIKRRMAQ